MTGRLTTHVLDTALGRPAAGLEITLYRVEGDGKQELGRFVTNDDGRVDGALLEGARFRPGTYQLEFAAGAYLDRVQGGAPAVPRFLDVIPIRFTVAAGEHYHVPLLLSPFGYSTYRGS